MIAAMDLLRGPQGKGAFEPNEHVTCDYTEEKPLGGQTPKCRCVLAPDDIVKVRYGKGNREVYGQVAGSRLLWALGFGADRNYPVKVTCRNCPIEPWYWRTERRVALTTFEPATIQRPFHGETIEAPGYKGWAWPELEQVDERSGGAPLAQRDALKLLAAFLQHTDSKADNQRLVCLPEGVVRDEAGNEDCTKPFMYITDLGVTFGRATRLNNTGVDFGAWESEPVWRSPRQCVGNLRKSFTGTLDNPRISEAGRKLLADLLLQLSDGQIHDIFAAARVDRREQKIHTPQGDGLVTFDDWVRVFKRKRDEIVNQRCAARAGGSIRSEVEPKDSLCEYLPRDDAER